MHILEYIANHQRIFLKGFLTISKPFITAHASWVNSFQFPVGSSSIPLTNWIVSVASSPPSQKKEHTICEPSLGIEVECYLFSGGAISILMSTSFANLGLPRQGAINHTPRIHRRVQLICHCLNAQGLLEFSQASVPYAAY